MTTRYTGTPEGLTIFGSNEFFNRVLYGGHDRDDRRERFFTFAGDAPVFMGALSDYSVDNWCRQAKNGVLKLGLALTHGHVEPGHHDLYSGWFDDSSDCFATWRHGFMSYRLTRFSPWFPDAAVALEVYPLNPDEGFLVCCDISVDQETVFCAGFGGLTDFAGRFEYRHSAGRRFVAADARGNDAERTGARSARIAGPVDTAMEIGCDFASEWRLDGAEALAEEYPSQFLTEHPGEANIVKISRVLKPGEHFTGRIVVLRNASAGRLGELLRDGELPRKLRNAIRRKSAAIAFHSPEKSLDGMVTDLTCAHDASFHGRTYFHGAIGYHAPFLGWRGWYAPALIGDCERVRTAIRSHFGTITRSAESERVWYDGAERPDLDHEGTQYHHLTGSSGHLTAMLDKDDIYDMQEVAVDMTLRYFDRTRDLELGTEIFDRLAEVLAWEERVLDPDGDGLYQNFLNTWISDGHSYNGGGCAQASCYNLFANERTAALGRLLGRDVAVFEARAARIRRALGERLWLEDRGVLAEYVDTVGNQLVHGSAELSTVYLAIDCGAVTAEQGLRMCGELERSVKSVTTPIRGGRLFFSSNWRPKKYSTCGIFPAENAALALAYFELGEREKAWEILRGLCDAYDLSHNPGSIRHVLSAQAGGDDGDIDFTDVSGCVLRTLIAGLWGVRFDLIAGRIELMPQLPDDWDNASLAVKNLACALRRESFADEFDVSVSSIEACKTISVLLPLRLPEIDGVFLDGDEVDFTPQKVGRTAFCRVDCGARTHFVLRVVYRDAALLRRLPEPVASPRETRHGTAVDLTGKYNASVCDIHARDYVAPRPAGYSIGVRRNGRYAWDWNSFGHNAVRPDDSCLRNAGAEVFQTATGIGFAVPAKGANVCCASIWENFPARLEIPLTGKHRALAVLFLGSTNAMQSGVVNARFTVRYADGEASVTELIAPDSFDDFLTPALIREGEIVSLGAGTHGIMRKLELDPARPVAALISEGVANEAIIGILGLTLLDD